MFEQHPTVIVYGPTGSGKTTAAAALRDVFGCASVLDDWSQDEQIEPGCLHLTNNYEFRRGGPTVCMTPDFKVTVPIRVFSLQEALDLCELRITRDGAGRITLWKNGIPICGTIKTNFDADRAAAVNAALTDAVQRLGAAVDEACDTIHRINVEAGWWSDLETGEDLHGKRNVGELLALVHSEVSEALEGHRKGLMDDKLPHRPMFRVELVDTMIRLFDILGSEQNDEHPAGEIFVEKVLFNMGRADHKPENRRLAGGKKI